MNNAIVISQINEAILHWLHDLYIPLLLGTQVKYTVSGNAYWDNTGELLKTGSDNCILCRFYFRVVDTQKECPDCPLSDTCILCRFYFRCNVVDTQKECPDCPLTKVHDICIERSNSSYRCFMNNPCTETAIKMIQSLARARDYYLDKDCIEK